MPAEAHRARISLDMRGATYRWIAPYEAMPPQGSAAVRGRLTAFVDTGAPQLDAALTNFDCRVIKVFDESTHHAFLCEVVQVRERQDGAALIYLNGGFCHVPQTASA